MINYFKRVKTKVKLFIKIYIIKNYSEIDRWFYDGGDRTLRLNYKLSENSIVFDVGGYVGDWSASIYKKYKCNIYIFEPVKEYYELISKRFKNNNKIKVYNFGLGAQTIIYSINKSNDGSSLYFRYSDDCEKEEVKIVSINEFISDNKIKDMDLIKINIEGGEYELLNFIIQKGLHKKCNNIQVQFHPGYPNYVLLRDKIRNSLAKTHHLTYDYTFVWENWEINF